MRSNRARVLAGLAFAVLASGLVPSATYAGWTGASIAHSQNLGQRVVSGKVLDASDGAVTGATVFLKDSKTRSIRSYTSTADGHFRFTGVNMAEDHDLWAEKDGKKSAIKNVSSWDTRSVFECELKLK